jgi:isopentenyl-diphosphate Delta-isomerase
MGSTAGGRRSADLELSATTDRELVVLLDDSGAAVGTAAKRDVHSRNTPFHLGFSCYVFRADGRALLTQRALSKRTWPGAWTNSCCGHPHPREDLEDAVRRRLAHELSLEPRDMEVVLPDFRYRATMEDGTVEHELCPVVFAAVGSDPDARPDEVSGWQWVTWPELSAVATRPDFSPWAREQLALLDTLDPPPHEWFPARRRRLPNR